MVSEKRPTLSIFQKIENMNLALNAAKGIGCVVTNVNAKVRFGEVEQGHLGQVSLVAM